MSFSCHEPECCLLSKSNYKTKTSFISSKSPFTSASTASTIPATIKQKQKQKLKFNFKSISLSSSSTSSSTSSVSTSRKIKNILKPVLGKIFKSTKSKYAKKSNSYIPSNYNDYNYNDDDDDDKFYNDNYYNNWWKSEKSDNDANEELEERLIEEIQNSPDDAAIFIFNDTNNGTIKNLKTINKEKFYIPVHFARTNAGTFFWTSIQKSSCMIDPFKIEWNFLDRWAQA